MSGGSYNYLCHKFDVDELIRGGMQDLQSMTDRLAGLGYASDAARESEELLLTIRQMQNRTQVMMDRLRDVWQAVEWWDSCDSDEDRVKDALKKYRGKK